MAFVLKGNPMHIVGNEEKLVKFKSFEQFEKENSVEVLKTIKLINVNLDPELFTAKLNNYLNTKLITSIHLENIYYCGTFENVYLPSLQEFHLSTTQNKDEDLNNPTVLFFYKDGMESDWDRTEIWNTKVNVSLKFDGQLFLETNHQTKSLYIKMKSSYDVEQILINIKDEDVREIALHFTKDEKLDLCLLPISLAKLDIEINQFDWESAEKLMFRLPQLKEFIFKPTGIRNGKMPVKINELTESMKHLSLIGCAVELAEKAHMNFPMLDSFALYNCSCAMNVFEVLNFRKLVMMESTFGVSNITFDQLDEVHIQKGELDWIYSDAKLNKEGYPRFTNGMVYGKLVGQELRHKRHLFLEEKHYLEIKYFGVIPGLGYSCHANFEHEFAGEPETFILKAGHQLSHGDKELVPLFDEFDLAISTKHICLEGVRVYNERLPDIWQRVNSLEFIMLKNCSCSWPVGPGVDKGEILIPWDPNFSPRFGPASMNLSGIPPTVKGITLENTKVERPKDFKQLEFLNIINAVNLSPEYLDSLSGMFSAKQVAIQQPSITPSCLKPLLGIKNIEQLLITKFSMDQRDKNFNEIIQFFSKSSLGGWEHNILLKKNTANGEWIGKYVNDGLIGDLMKAATNYQWIQIEDKTDCQPVTVYTGTNPSGSNCMLVDFKLINPYIRKPNNSYEERLRARRPRGYSYEKINNFYKARFIGNRNPGHIDEIGDNLVFDSNYQISHVDLQHIKIDPKSLTKIFANHDPSFVKEIWLENVEFTNMDQCQIFPNLKELKCYFSNFNYQSTVNVMDNILSSSTSLLKFLGIFLPNPSTDLKNVWNLCLSFEFRTGGGYLRIRHEDRSLTANNIPIEILMGSLESDEASNEIQSISITSIPNFKGFPNMDFPSLKHLVIDSIPTATKFSWEEFQNFLFTHCPKLLFLSFIVKHGTSLKEAITVNISRLPKSLKYLKFANVNLEYSEHQKPLELELLFLQNIYHSKDFFDIIHLYFQAKRLIYISPSINNQYSIKRQAQQTSSCFQTPNSTILNTILKNCLGTEWLYLKPFEHGKESETFMLESMHDFKTTEFPEVLMLERISKNVWRKFQNYELGDLSGREYYFPLADHGSFNLVDKELFKNSLYYFNGFPHGEVLIPLKSLHLEKVRFSWEYLISELLKVDTSNLESITLKWNSIFGEDLDPNKKIYLPNLKSFYLKDNNCYNNWNKITWDKIAQKIIFVKLTEQRQNWTSTGLWDAGIQVTVNNNVIYPIEQKLVLDFEESNELLLHASKNLEFLSFRSLHGLKPYIIPTNLKYLELQTGMKWEELEPQVSHLEYLEELRFAGPLSGKEEITIRKLPKQLKTLAIEHVVLNFELKEIIKLNSILFMDCMLKHNNNNFIEYLQMDEFYFGISHAGYSVNDAQIVYDMLKQPQLRKLFVGLSVRKDGIVNNTDAEMFKDLLVKGDGYYPTTGFIKINVGRDENGEWQKLEGPEQLQPENPKVILSFTN